MNVRPPDVFELGVAVTAGEGVDSATARGVAAGTVVFVGSGVGGGTQAASKNAAAKMLNKIKVFIANP